MGTGDEQPPCGLLALPSSSTGRYPIVGANPGGRAASAPTPSPSRRCLTTAAAAGSSVVAVWSEVSVFDVEATADCAAAWPAGVMGSVANAATLTSRTAADQRRRRWVRWGTRWLEVMSSTLEMQSTNPHRPRVGLSHSPFAVLGVVDPLPESDPDLPLRYEDIES
ncbi:hypothetical protein [Gordonia sputi]